MKFMLIPNKIENSLESGSLSEMQMKAITSIDVEEMKITDSKLFKIGAPFEKTWYKISDKSTKNKLGKLYHATLKMHNRDREKNVICRVIDMERISSYTVENFENRLKMIM